MSLSKLKRLHVIIIGSVACVVCAAGLYFLLIKPLDASIAETTAQLDASRLVANQLDTSVRDLDAAKSEVIVNEAKLNRYQVSKMPNISFAERDKGMIQLWHEQSETLGPLLERWGSKHGTLLSGMPIPAPPANPNELQPGMIKISVGKVDVAGNFRSLLSNIRSWNQCPRLVQIDRPSLSGTSPFLKASYELTVYIFPRTDPGPQIAMAGAGAAAAAAPAAAPAAPAPPADSGGGEDGGGMRGGGGT
jgi:hypothetical protein